MQKEGQEHIRVRQLHIQVPRLIGEMLTAKANLLERVPRKQETVCSIETVV